MQRPKFYIGLDAHKDSVTYVVRDYRGSIVLEGKCATHYKDLKSVLGPYLISAKVAVEASTSYYQLYSAFKAGGTDIVVANPLQLRQLVAKSDPLDARRLSDMLRLGTMPTSYIPEENIQQLRSLVHLRHALSEETTRWKNRIQALLDWEGIRFPGLVSFRKKWGAALELYLGSPRGSIVIRHAYEQYLTVAAKKEQVTQLAIDVACEHWKCEYDLLQSIPGTGPVLSCYFIAEICPVTRFSSKKKLRRYAGVIPVEKQSGRVTGRSRLPKHSRRRLLCWALVAAATVAGKTKTPLGDYYRRKKKQKKKANVAKMAVASTISDIVYHTLTTGKPYPPSKK